MVSARPSGRSCLLLFTRSFCLCLQDFPLLRLDDVVNDQSNIVGFSMLNISHPFYLEFIRSLNLSWREGCDVSPYPGPAVRRDRVRPRERLTSPHLLPHYQNRWKISSVLKRLLVFIQLKGSNANVAFREEAKAESQK